MAVAIGVPARDDPAALDLRGIEMEVHVQAALEAAFALAGKEPVQPSHVIEAVVRAALSSAAFDELRRLVPLPESGAAPGAPPAGAPLPAARLDVALRRHLEIARRPLEDGGAPPRLWGRDLITAVLLCSREAAGLIERTGRSI